MTNTYLPAKRGVCAVGKEAEVLCDGFVKIHKLSNQAPMTTEAHMKKKRNNPTAMKKQKHREKQTSRKPKCCQQANAEQELT